MPQVQIYVLYLSLRSKIKLSQTTKGGWLQGFFSKIKVSYSRAAPAICLK